MPTITKIKNKGGTVWRVQVHVNGVREGRRFTNKPDAVRWGNERELELRDTGELIPGKTMGHAFARYADEIITDERRGARWDRTRLKKFGTDPIARVPASDLKLTDGEDFIRRGLERGLKPNTIIRELNLLKPVVRQAVRWKWLARYPWDDLRQPKPGKARNRLYTPDEITRIYVASGLIVPEITTRTQEVGLAFVICCEAGFRLNEVCSLRREWVDLDRRVASLPEHVTKTLDARNVPLSTVAINALKRLPDRGPNYFRIHSAGATALFTKIKKRAGIEGATFHDSRHRAVTTLSKKFDVLALAKVIGHSDPRQLMTYYEADAESLAGLLD